MGGLKRITKAIREANYATDRCSCGHKKRMHVWPTGELAGCKVALCSCDEYGEPPTTPSSKPQQGDKE